MTIQESPLKPSLRVRLEPSQYIPGVVPKGFGPNPGRDVLNQLAGLLGRETDDPLGGTLERLAVPVRGFREPLKYGVVHPPAAKLHKVVHKGLLAGLSRNVQEPDVRE